MRQYKNKKTENGCGGFGILLIFCWICFFGIRSFFEGVLFLLNIFPVILGILFVCCLISIASRDALKYIFEFGVILGIFYLSGLVLYEVIHFICQHWIISLSVISVVIFLFLLLCSLDESDTTKSEQRKELPAGNPSSEEKAEPLLEQNPHPALCSGGAVEESRENKTEDSVPDYRHSPNYGKIIQKRRG